jgi:hypothetical protein
MLPDAMLRSASQVNLADKNAVSDFRAVSSTAVGESTCAIRHDDKATNVWFGFRDLLRIVAIRVQRICTTGDISRLTRRNEHF